MENLHNVASSFCFRADTGMFIHLDNCYPVEQNSWTVAQHGSQIKWFATAQSNMLVYHVAICSGFKSLYVARIHTPNIIRR